jgi:hypothetical protein
MSIRPLLQRCLNWIQNPRMVRKEIQPLLLTLLPTLHPLLKMDKVDLKLLAATLKHPKETPFTRYSSPSPSSVDPDISSVSSIPSQLSGSGGRSQRNRHPAKILQPQPEIAQYDGAFNGLLTTMSMQAELDRS